MKVLAIIPARMGSTRFPGKPLRAINGFPMVGHCYCRTAMTPSLFDTYVATCDQEIYDFVTSVGGKCVMTSADHERASDRAAEAMLTVEAAVGEKFDVVVMVQGDEPMVTSTMIQAALEPMIDDPTVNVVNLMAKISDVGQFRNPNEVKVVVNALGNALYFSREPIPSKSKFVGPTEMLKQVCVIPFRRDFLLKFNAMPQSYLEKVESIDMLRILESGGDVRMVLTEESCFSVDTEEDRVFVENAMKHDPLMKRYTNG